jgi:dihydropteroate synthase
MIHPEYQFLLNDIPADIALSYLKRTFRWQLDKSNQSPVTIFLHYFKHEPPEICTSLIHAFPGFCKLANRPAGGNAFLIAAHFTVFCRIFNFLATSEESQLFLDIETLFNRHSNPSFKVGNLTWGKDQPRIMGILNITPDSFYDGGNFFQRDDYGAVAEQMIQAGADIIDIGGESSRPGAEGVTEREELNRILKVVKQIRQRFHIPLSIDTTKPAVADAALAAGADMINDISGLAAGPEMIRIIRKHNASYCLMHIQGTPAVMQHRPHYDDIIGEIYQFFQSKLNICYAEGLRKNRILLDPGIGFGKTVLDNMDILRLLPAFSNFNNLIMIGTSNKSFIGKILQHDLNHRTPGTLATQALGWIKGATVFRVHSVQETKDTVEMAKYYTQNL